MENFVTISWQLATRNAVCNKDLGTWNVFAPDNGCECQPSDFSINFNVLEIRPIGKVISIARI